MPNVCLVVDILSSSEREAASLPSPIIPTSRLILFTVIRSQPDTQWTLPFIFFRYLFQWGGVKDRKCANLCHTHHTTASCQPRLGEGTRGIRYPLQTRPFRNVPRGIRLHLHTLPFLLRLLVHLYYLRIPRGRQEHDQQTLGEQGSTRTTRQAARTPLMDTDSA